MIMSMAPLVSKVFELRVHLYTKKLKNKSMVTGSDTIRLP